MATTENPLPASPALAASIAALSESILVSSDISVIVLSICSISLVLLESSEIDTETSFITSMLSVDLSFKVSTASVPSLILFIALFDALCTSLVQDTTESTSLPKPSAVSTPFAA